MNVFNVFSDGYIFQIRAFIECTAIPVAGFDPLDGIRQPDAFQCGTMAETIRGNGLRTFFNRDGFQRFAGSERSCPEGTAGQRDLCQCSIVECAFADLLDRIREQACAQF